LFGKLGSLIASEAKKSGGNMDAPGLRTAIEKAKKENMPKDTIERAVKKGAGGDAKTLELLTYEAYGPGGCALIVEVLSDNRNKSAQDIKHILSKHGAALAEPGSALWAFTKGGEGWEASVPVPLSDADGEQLSHIIEALEDHEEVQDVYTNAE
jgi:transcriptional/translational regulatory protein YebC/TACO1